MILADKIVRLRKKYGWSQEELAEKMDISRQAVSKWESAQTVPDLGRILQLARLFGVSTDYLLKDEIEIEKFDENICSSEVRYISISEAEEYLKWKKTVSIRTAIATLICILSAVPLIILGAASEASYFKISEDIACSIGVSVLLVFIAAAVAIYISCDYKNSKFGFIDKEPFNIDYEVKTMIRERQNAYHKTYVKYNIIGTCLCIISPLPLFISFGMNNEFLSVVMTAILILIISIGTALFIICGVQYESLKKLLNEVELEDDNSKKIKKAVISIYWLLAVAFYIGWSLISDDWTTTWKVWPVAGVLFAAVMIICNLILGKYQKNN